MSYFGVERNQKVRGSLMFVGFDNTKAGGGELRLFKVWGGTDVLRDYPVNDAALENAGKCYGVLKVCCVFTFLLQNVLKFIPLI